MHFMPAIWIIPRSRYESGLPRSRSVAAAAPAQPWMEPEVNCKLPLLLNVCVLLFVSPLLAGGPSGANAPAATAPSTRPTSGPKLVATVGKVRITSQRIEKLMQEMPASAPQVQRSRLRNKIVNDMIFQALISAYMEANKVTYRKEDLDTIKGQIAEEAGKLQMTAEQLMKKVGVTEEHLKDQARANNLLTERTSKAKVAAFIKSNPAYFNGTKVRASHILIKCDPLESTEKQKASVAKLEGIVADIRAGKIKFADAAKAHSEGPSGKNGGDLGEFEFARMVPPFAMQAFDIKVGDISPIVRTRFGFHVIQVTKRTEGTAKPSENAERTALNCLSSLLQNEIFDQALRNCPIVLYKK